MHLGKHLTDEQFQLLVEEMEYYRMINDQKTSIQNLKLEDYEYKKLKQNDNK